MVLIIMDTYSNILVSSIYLLFGKRGDSPTEMLSMENFRLQNHVVWTLDANKSELTRLDFSSSGDSLLRDETVTLDEDILRPL